MGVCREGSLHWGWGLKAEKVVDDGRIKGGLCHKKKKKKDPGRTLSSKAGFIPTRVSGAMRVR